MELSALPGSGPASTRLEGRTEGVRDGRVAVRLSSGSVLEIETSEAWPPGTPVVLAAGSDGRIQILPKAQGNVLSEARQALWEALERILPKPQAAAGIAQALAKNDYAQAASLLEPAADGSPSSLLSRPAQIVPPSSASIVDLLSQVEPGRFQARVAGVSWELWSSSELSTPQRFPAKASILPNGAAIWTPTQTTDRPPSAPLPDFVKTDIQGARLLLGQVDASQAPPEVAQDLAAFLRRVAERRSESRPTTTGRPPSDPPPPPGPASNPPGPSASPESAASGANTTSRLDTPTALRALVAWSLGMDAEHPGLPGLMGKGSSLPDILEGLANHLSRGERKTDPDLQATLSRILATGRLGPEERMLLEEQIQKALARPSDSAALDTEPEKPQLADAAKALLGERLGELGRDLLVRGETVWIRQEAGWRQERIVVHDRRRRGPEERPDHHVAQIRLEPRGAGTIDAKLVLDGRNLTVRMEADSSATVQLLRDNLSDLREALDRTGLFLSGLDVAKRVSPTAEGSAKRGSGGSFDVRA
ncbi:MAG TPA: flagellar hook-length control protein FliK [Fibrobacteria bacterium]|nr:flagellar hook-length control protein FliK [Fibrobacteria bacterium]